MATATDLIEDALGHLGLNSPGDGVDGTVATRMLSILNTMVDGWNLPGPVAYGTVTVSATLTSGQYSKTIGPAMDLATVRPVRIEDGSFVRESGIDYQFKGEMNEAQYNALALKTTNPGYVPEWFYYDSGASTGTIYYWPPAGVTCTVFHPVQTQITEFADLTTNYVLVQGMRRAIGFGLAVEASGSLDVEASPRVVSLAASSLLKLKRSNLQVPQLDMSERGPKESILWG